MKRFPTSVIKFGIFVAVTVVLTGLLITVIGNISFVKSHSYTAVFKDATQVSPGDEVRLAGVKVGTVSSLHLYDRNYAEVHFTVEDSVPFYSTSRVAIQYQNLIGQRYLAIDEKQSNVRQDPHTPIPVQRTVDALNLTTLFNGFKPLFQALTPAQVNKLSFETIQTLQGESGTLQQLMSNTAQLTTTIADKDAVIGQVIDNFNAVLATVDSRDSKLTALIGNFRDLMTGLSHNRVEVSNDLPNIASLLTATTGLLAQARPPLKSDIANLRVLATRVDSTKGQLNDVLHRLPHKLSVLTRSATYGSWFNFYLCGANLRLTLLGQAIHLTTPVGISSDESNTVCGKGPGAS
jgi:phospholipid/cholesterol/gamma-HCH transport system substrate-binding protein